jgi:hypothetical protein
MDENIVVIRMLERILVVLFGGVSIYLGYRLFFHVPMEKRSGGELSFPGMKIVLTRVGPGVFFAAFGSVVLLYSLTNPISVKTAATKDASQVAQADASEKTSTKPAHPARASNSVDEFEFIGAGAKVDKNMDDPVATKPSSTSITPQQRTRATSSLQMLNCLSQLVPSIDGLGRMSDQAELAIRDAKVALISTVWDEEHWGDTAQLTPTGLSPDAAPELQEVFNAVHGGCPS